MKLALITPQFAPNMYDLAAMLAADEVIFTDTEIWSRKGRTHRAEIRTEDGSIWLNLPVLTADKKKPIREVRLDSKQRWFEPFWNTLALNYSHAVYFDYFADELRNDLEQAEAFSKLIDFNLYFFSRILKYLEIEIPFKLAGRVKGYSSVPEETMRNLGADALYMEHHSRNYLRQPDAAPLFSASPPVYRQAFPEFRQGCSVLDLLLNVGPESYKILDPLLHKS